MKVKERYDIPERTAERVVKVICDMCGEDIKTGNFRADESHVGKTEGTSYPECGNGVKIEYDVCISCSDTKIVPFMESFGAKTVVEDWDF